jgi:hypothetical protein
MAYGAYAIYNQTEKLEHDEFNQLNIRTDDGPKMYVASYVVPDVAADCFSQIGKNCDPGTDSATDAVTTGWARFQVALPQAKLVITTSVIRGVRSQDCKCQSQTTPTGCADADLTCPVGQVPVVTITVQTEEERPPQLILQIADNALLSSSSEISPIKTFVADHGRAGELALWAATSHLRWEERQDLADGIEAALRGNSFTLTEEQVNILQRVVKKLPEELKKIEKEDTEKGGSR